MHIDFIYRQHTYYRYKEPLQNYLPTINAETSCLKFICTKFFLQLFFLTLNMFCYCCCLIYFWLTLCFQRGIRIRIQKGSKCSKDPLGFFALLHLLSFCLRRLLPQLWNLLLMLYFFFLSLLLFFILEFDHKIKHFRLDLLLDQYSVFFNLLRFTVNFKIK